MLLMANTGTDANPGGQSLADTLPTLIGLLETKPGYGRICDGVDAAAIRKALGRAHDAFCCLAGLTGHRSRHSRENFLMHLMIIGSVVDRGAEPLGL